MQRPTGACAAVAHVQLRTPNVQHQGLRPQPMARKETVLTRCISGVWALRISNGAPMPTPLAVSKSWFQFCAGVRTRGLPDPAGHSQTPVGQHKKPIITHLDSPRIMFPHSGLVNAASFACSADQRHALGFTTSLSQYQRPYDIENSNLYDSFVS